MKGLTLKDFALRSKWTSGALVVLAILHILAYLVLGSPVLNAIILVIIGSAVVWIGYKRLEFAMLIVLLEVFIGGHGLLFSVPVVGFTLTLRMVLFGVLFAIWFLHMAKGNYRPVFIRSRDAGWFLLFAVIAAATILGVLQFPFREAFDDANSYFYAALVLPMISIPVSKAWKRSLLQVLIVAVLWLGISSLLLTYLFMHLNVVQIDQLYTFVRDARLYEVTLQIIERSTGPLKYLGAVIGGGTGYWYRLFGQSQLISIFGGIILSSALMIGYRDQRAPKGLYSVLTLALVVLIIGFSRSFILAAGMIIAFIAIGSWFYGKKRFKTLPTRIAAMLTASVVAVIALVAVVQIPLPGVTTIEELSQRDTDTSRDVAISSRWNLLGPMLEEVKESPFAGHGFGKSVTYKSEDPRVVNETGNGIYTTYRFEWGYLDLWLKMGVFGLLAIALIFWSFTRAAVIQMKKAPNAWLTLGLYGTLLVLFMVHMLTPYLNHPIGISWLVFLIPFFDFSAIPLASGSRLRMPWRSSSLSQVAE